MVLGRPSKDQFSSSVRVRAGECIMIDDDRSAGSAYIVL